MIGLALVLATTPIAADQLLAGMAFERFAAVADRECPARRLRAITPGDLDGRQEVFLDTLSPARRARVAARNDADRRCAGRDGLACPTTATLAALVRARMMHSFVEFACRAPTTR